LREYCLELLKNRGLNRMTLEERRSSYVLHLHQHPRRLTESLTLLIREPFQAELQIKGSGETGSANCYPGRALGSGGLRNITLSSKRRPISANKVPNNLDFG